MDHVVASQEEVFALLANPATHGQRAVKRIDTHAAVVFLARERALKVKRAVRFPFLDFSTLEKREAACDAERCAPVGGISPPSRSCASRRASNSALNVGLPRQASSKYAARSAGDAKAIAQRKIDCSEVTSFMAASRGMARDLIRK